MFSEGKMKSKKIIVSAHQPNFMPYLGFFDKMQKSDIFVIRDEVLYLKKEYHNRNRIKIQSHDPNMPNSKWLNVPIKNSNNYIMHIEIKKNTQIKNKRFWNEQILNDIKSNYQKAPYFNNFFKDLEKIFDNSEDNLISLNMKIINFLKKAFHLNTKIIMASELGLKPKNYTKSNASEDLMNICKSLKADIYLSGNGGKEYLDLKPFNENKIQVRFQEYKHPVYSQVFPNFLPYMSAIDALFCCGIMPSSKIPIKIK
jgi:hypothetical protein